jgi:hypothetical protein
MFKFVLKMQLEKKSNHVIPTSAGWVVRKTGAARAIKVFKTKELAIVYGRTLSKAEKSALYIHRQNGMIQKRSVFYHVDKSQAN